MFILAWRRFTVLVLSVLSLFTTAIDRMNPDYCGNYDFPRIAAEEQEPDTLRIMSFNIRVDGVNGNKTYERMWIGCRQILEIMPDSFGLQEASDIWMIGLDTLLKKYDWVGVDIGEGGDILKGGTASPVFYRSDKFELLDWGCFWVSDTPEVPSILSGADYGRICTWVKLKNRQTGQIYAHVNTHLDYMLEACDRGAEIVSRFIEEHLSDVPVVFTADLNASEKSGAYAAMTRYLTDARLAAEDCIAYGTFHDGKDPNNLADYYIDFVLCSDDFSVASYRTVTKGVHNRFTSDHFPIYADLRFGGV